MVHRLEQGPLTGAFQCILQIARSPLLVRSLLAQLLEPPRYGPVCQVVWEGRSREAPPYPDHWHYPAVSCNAASRSLLKLLRTICPRPQYRPPLTHAARASGLYFSRAARRTISLQSVGNLGAATASNIEGPTDLDGVSLCFETEISRCALNSCMAQQRSNCLQIASAFQNVESLRPT